MFVQFGECVDCGCDIPLTHPHKKLCSVCADVRKKNKYKRR